MIVDIKKRALHRAKILEGQMRGPQKMIEIIKAQTREISDMYKWQTEWGYPSDEIMQEMHGH